MIAENIENIRRRIITTCQKIRRSPEEIKIVAVSKTFDSVSVQKAINAGILDIGESYVQELRKKKLELSDEKIKWHFVGHLQSNKVKYIAEWINLIHAVDSTDIGSEISKYAAKYQRCIDVLVEVNTSGEKTKFGVNVEDARKVLKELRQFSNINVAGLMTIGPFSEDQEKSRASFRTLRELKESLEVDGYHLPELSMGMTNDFEVAIEEGATIIRIGTAIFGSRI